MLMPTLYGFEACTGCALCVLPCPVWRDSYDPWLTPHGRARAMQGGADVIELTDSLMACTMCGACDPVCPENIDLTGAVRNLRLLLTKRDANPLSKKLKMDAPVAPGTPAAVDSQAMDSRVFIAGGALAADSDLMQRVQRGLGEVTLAVDDGNDLARAFEAGAVIDETRAKTFAERLRHAKEIIVVDGMLAIWLREQPSMPRVSGLAEVLLRDSQRVAAFRKTDLFILDAQSFHSAYDRVLPLADNVSRVSGCRLNLDLQRVAIPAAEIEWILQGLNPERIIVENPADLAYIRAQCDQEVVHLVDIGS